MTSNTCFTRRRFMQSSAVLALAAGLPVPFVMANPSELIQKVIPSTGEKIPAVGMGSWMTFNVGNDMAARKNCIEVLRAFMAGGGGLIDSSPMYGSSEEVIGYCLAQLKSQGLRDNTFSATKVWTPIKSMGVNQAQDSEKFWGTSTIDLQQVHNLVSWQDHLETLRKLKEDKRLRYIGISTSHGRRHSQLEKIMKTEQIDFVQLTYNILDIEVEKRLLPLAQEKGIAIIANRPFRRRGLIEQFADKPLPKWAPDIHCSSWAQFFLKFIISHPVITCAIPATSQVAHMNENMAVLQTPLPDAKTRKKMRDYVLSL